MASNFHLDEKCSFFTLFVSTWVYIYIYINESSLWSNWQATENACHFVYTESCEFSSKIYIRVDVYIYMNREILTEFALNWYWQVKFALFAFRELRIAFGNVRELESSREKLMVYIARYVGSGCYIHIYTRRVPR